MYVCIYIHIKLYVLYMCMCMYVCVCVCRLERRWDLCWSHWHHSRHRDLHLCPQRWQRSCRWGRCWAIEGPQTVIFIVMLVYQRVSREYLWNIYGTSMEYLWNIYGISMEYLWDMEYFWDMMRYLWDFIGYSWNIRGIPPWLFQY